MSADPARWHPVAASGDLPHGHVCQTMLGGHVLAIWRAADGRVNVWEDRCPHRGVRFSIGMVDGDGLRCQYHAWRFASGSGACTHIPAQPAAKPAAAIRAQVWPVAEAGGLVWTGVAPEGAPPALAGEVLRAMPVNCAAAVVEAALAGAVQSSPERVGGPPAGWGRGACHEEGEDERKRTLFVQPVDAGRSVIRGVCAPGALHATDAALERLRRVLEAAQC